MDALTMLKEEHREAQQMFKKIANAEGQKAKQLWTQLNQALSLHEKMEEMHLYPQLKADPKMKEKDLVLEAYEEHHAAETLQAEIDALDVSAENWHAKVKVLQEQIDHHIEEEEGELFPAVREVWDSKRLQEVGEAMMKMKQQAQGSQKKAA